MTASIDEDTVDFKPNYDGRETEPVVLPAALPNLLVNGASRHRRRHGDQHRAAQPHRGRAGAATPHQPPVGRPRRHHAVHPRTRPADRRQDRRARGHPRRLRHRATARSACAPRPASRASRRAARASSITELPYNVGPEKVIEAIKKLVQAKKLQGISDIKNLTDRHKGLNLVIEVKNGFIPETILEQLYKLTPMESSFGINAVALVDGQPRTLGLKEMLEVFLDHRYDVVRRRTQFRRGKAADRLHLVDGLLIALVDIDEVIQLIRASDDRGRGPGTPHDGLRPVRHPGRLHPRPDPRPADQVLTASSSRARLPSLRKIIDELDAILADEQLLR